MKSTQQIILLLVFVTAASAGVSRSDVYFNMGGSQVAYGINHRPDPNGAPNAVVSVSRDAPAHHHHLGRDPVLHVPVTVAASTIHPPVAYPFFYPGIAGLHAPVTSFRQPKHHPSSYYSYTYSPYYPYAGHPGFIFVA